jgi:peptide/nickel transport system substrate-binding protein
MRSFEFVLGVEQIDHATCRGQGGIMLDRLLRTAHGRRRVAVASPVLLIVALLLTAAATASRGDTQASPAGIDSVTLRLTSDWRTLDPMVDAGWVYSWGIASPAYDRLLSVGAGGPNAPLQPYLATSWVQKAKSATFTLRTDAKCTDGHVLTALDVLNSVKRFLFVPKRSGQVKSGPTGGFGPGPYHLHSNNKTHTFSLSLDKPWRNLLVLFANLPIICPSGLAAAASDPHALEAATYGSGPYTLASLNQGDQVVYKLRPDWKWGPPGTSAATMPKTLTYKLVVDQTTATNLFLTGGLDYGVVIGPDVDRLAEQSSLARYAVPNYQVTSLVFNQRQGRIFADPDGEFVRQAVMTAVDRSKFNQAAYRGTGQVSSSNFRPGADCFEPKTRTLIPTPSLDAAKQVLTTHGYTYSGGTLLKGGQQPKIVFLTSQDIGAGADYVFSVLQALGFDVDFQNLARPAYGASFINGNFDLSIQAGNRSSNAAGEAQDTITGPPPPAGLNYSATGYQDAEMQRWVLAANQSPGQGGCKYWSLVQTRMLQKHYIFPMAAPNFDFFGRKGISFPPYIDDSVAYPIYYIKPAK